MPTAVKLSDEMVEAARAEAAVMERSIAGQVEYWARIGRTLEASGALDYEQVRAVLCGEGSVHELSPAENALYLELLRRDLEALDGSDAAVPERLAAGGHPVAGEDEDGKLVVRRAHR